MNYRPQFVYPPPPEGWRDEDFEYSFNLTTCPRFNCFWAWERK